MPRSESYPENVYTNNRTAIRFRRKVVDVQLAAVIEFGQISGKPVSILDAIHPKGKVDASKELTSSVRFDYAGGLVTRSDGDGTCRWSAAGHAAGWLQPAGRLAVS